MEKPLCCRCAYMFNCGNHSYARIMRNGNTCESFEQVRKHNNDEYNRAVIERSDYIAKKASWNCPECRDDIF